MALGQPNATGSRHANRDGTEEEASERAVMHIAAGYKIMKLIVPPFEKWALATMRTALPKSLRPTVE
jgi:hypothetical protein